MRWRVAGISFSCSNFLQNTNQGSRRNVKLYQIQQYLENIGVQGYPAQVAQLEKFFVQSLRVCSSHCHFINVRRWFGSWHVYKDGWTIIALDKRKQIKNSRIHHSEGRRHFWERHSCPVFLQKNNANTYSTWCTPVRRDQQSVAKRKGEAVKVARLDFLAEIPPNFEH